MVKVGRFTEVIAGSILLRLNDGRGLGSTVHYVFKREALELWADLSDNFLGKKAFLI